MRSLILSQSLEPARDAIDDLYDYAIASGISDTTVHFIGESILNFDSFGDSILFAASLVKIEDDFIRYQLGVLNANTWSQKLPRYIESLNPPRVPSLILDYSTRTSSWYGAYYLDLNELSDEEFGQISNAWNSFAKKFANWIKSNLDSLVKPWIKSNLDSLVKPWIDL